MGIKFHCPNGHKLNVKSFLAGKKGVCPKCGTSMRIPFVSTEVGGDSDIEQEAAATVSFAASAKGANGSAHAAPAAMPIAPRPVGPAAPAVPMGAPVMAAMPSVPLPSMAMPAMPARPAAVTVVPMTMPMPVGPLPLPPAVAAADPIAESPATTWYVRPPSGGQYGPARGDVMRKWVAEGRVSSDSLVWREGWADWANAGKLFPNLAAAAGGGSLAPAVPVATTPARSANRYLAQKKSGSGMAVAFLAVLAIVCVVLVGVLIYVLTTVK